MLANAMDFPKIWEILRAKYINILANYTATLFCGFSQFIQANSIQFATSSWGFFHKIREILVKIHTLMYSFFSIQNYINVITI